MHPTRCLLVPIPFLLLSAAAAAQTTTRVSVASLGAQANGASEFPSVSYDGSRIAFHSDASNLVAGDTAGNVDVFVRVAGTPLTERVSVSTSGVQPNGNCSRPSISDNGNLVAFQSLATNLDETLADSNGVFDVFVRDRVASTTVRASLDSNGAQANSASSRPSLSPEGAWVAFQSDATNLDLANADSNGITDVYLRDFASGSPQTIRISARALGAGAIAEANAACTDPSCAAGGLFVAFTSLASNLTAAGDSNGFDDVYVWDASGAITRVSLGLGGVEPDGPSRSPSISADGRWIAFESLASNLVDPILDTNGRWDIYRWDATTGAIELVSFADRNFIAGSDDSLYASISDDGRYVSFASLAINAVRCDSNFVRDVFRRDMLLRSTLRVSVAPPGSPANGPTTTECSSALSGDGHVAAFAGSATNLVAGDTNAWSDVFQRSCDDATPLQAVSYCTAGTTGNGCNALMTAQGEARVSQASGLIVAALGVEGQKNGVIFYGISGRVTNPWGTGGSSFLCVKSPVQQTGVRRSTGTMNACDGVLSVDLRDYLTCTPIAQGNPLHVGEVFGVQAWFKDPMSVKTTSLSNALEITIQP